MIRWVLGLDPAYERIPTLFKQSHTIDLVGWGTTVIEAVCDTVCAVKLQSAYFEAYGRHGMDAMATLITVSRKNKLKVIMDAKRGDIGETANAYAAAYLADTGPYSRDFVSDYLTVNPLMGDDCLDAFVSAAITHQKGLFVLLETSNPGSKMILTQQTHDGNCVADKIADYIQSVHDSLNLNGELGPIGVVVGATHTNGHLWRQKLPNSVFLMPGIGPQGGSMASVNACLRPDGHGVWAPLSRGLTNAALDVPTSDAFIAIVRANLQVYQTTQPR